MPKITKTNIRKKRQITCAPNEDKIVKRLRVCLAQGEGWGGVDYNAFGPQIKIVED